MYASEEAMAPHSCLENPMDGGAWWAAAHGVAKSQTRLSDFPFAFHFPALEKEMATHSSVLAWRIPGTGEPGGLLPMGSHRIRHNWSDLAAAAAYMRTFFFLTSVSVGVKSSLNKSSNDQIYQVISNKFKFPFSFVLADRPWERQGVSW